MKAFLTFIGKHKLLAGLVIAAMLLFCFQLVMAAIVDVQVRSLMAEVKRSGYILKKSWVTFSFWDGVRIGRLSAARAGKRDERFLTVNELRVLPDYAKLITTFNARYIIGSIDAYGVQVISYGGEKIAGSNFTVPSLTDVAARYFGTAVAVHDVSVAVGIPGRSVPLTVVSNIDVDMHVAMHGFLAAVYFSPDEKTRLTFRVAADAALTAFNGMFTGYDAGNSMFSWYLSATRSGTSVTGGMTEFGETLGTFSYDFSSDSGAGIFRSTRLNPTMVKKISVAALPWVFRTNSMNIIASAFDTEIHAITTNALSLTALRSNGMTRFSGSFDMRSRRSVVQAELGGDTDNVDGRLFVSYDAAWLRASAAWRLSKGIVPGRASVTVHGVRLGGSSLDASVLFMPYADVDRDGYLMSVLDFRYGTYYSARSDFSFLYDAQRKLFSFHDTNGNVMRVDAVLDLGAASTNILSVSFRSLPLVLLSSYIGAGSFASDLFIDADYTLRSGQQHGLKAFVRESYTGVTNATLSFSASKNTITVPQLSIKLPGGAIGINGSAERTADGGYAIRGMIDAPGMRTAVTGNVSGGRQRTVLVSAQNGSITIRGTADPGGVYLALRTGFLSLTKDIEASASCILATRAKPEARFTGDAHLRYKGQTPIDVLARFHYADGLVFERLSYAWGGETLTGTGRIYAEEALRIEGMLANTSSNGMLVFFLDFNKDNILGELNINNISTRQFFHLPYFEGTVQAKVTVSGTLQDPLVQFQKCSLLGTDFYAERYDITGRAQWRGQQLEVSDALVKKIGARGYFVPDEQVIQVYRALLSPQKQELKAEFRNFELFSIIDGKLSYTSQQRGKRRITSVLTSDIMLNKKKITPFSAFIEEERGVTTIVSETKHGMRGVIKRDANISDKTLVNVTYFYDGIDYVSAKGTVRAGNADLLLTSEELDATFLQFVNRVLFARIDGEAYPFERKGEKYTLYLSATGPVNDLEFNGRFRSKGKIRLNLFNMDFNDSVFDVYFEKKKLFINEFELREGDRAIKVSGAVFLARNFIDRLQLNLESTAGRYALPALAQLGYVRVEGPVSFDLEFNDSFTYPRISGAVLTRNSDIMFEKTKENYRPRYGDFFRNAAWNISVQGGNAVHFSSMYAGDVYVKEGAMLRILGRSIDSTLALRGTLEAQRGVAYYLNNNYQVETLSVTFPEVNSLDPIITGRGRTRKKYKAGSETLDVTLYLEVSSRLSAIIKNQVSGDSLPIRFYTIPSLKDEYVRELVGLPAVKSETAAGSEAGQVMGALANVLPADLLLREGVLRPIERNLRRFTGLDYFGIETGAFNKMSLSLLGATNLMMIAENPGYYIQDTRFSLGKYFSMNKYVNFMPDFFVKYNLTIAGSPGSTTYDRLFQHELAVELDLAQFSDLANLIFEYTMDPFNMTNVSVNLSTKWRF